MDLTEPPKDARPGIHAFCSEVPLYVRCLSFGEKRVDYSKVPSTVDVRLERAAIVQGRVVYGDSGKPAAGVRVQFQGIKDSAWGRAETDADGRYRFDSLGPDKYNIWASKDGYTMRAIDSFEALPGTTKTVADLRLVRGGFIVGNVVDADTGQPFYPSDAKAPPWFRPDVAMYGPSRPRSGPACEVTPIQADGSFRIRAAPGNNYVYLRVYNRSRAVPPAAMDVDVAEGQVVTVQFKVRQETIDSKPQKQPAVTAAVAEDAIVQRETIEHKAHCDETARLLEQQAGGIWRKDTLGKRLSCRTIWNDGPRGDTLGLYVVLPGSLDDAGKARAFVEVNWSAIPLDVLGCNDSLTVLASAPEKTPEFTAKIRAALKLEDPGFRIHPLRNDESRPQAAKLHGITTDIEQLRFDVLFYGGNDSPQFAMTLSVPKLTEESTAEWPKINITKDEAQRLLDAIHEAISFGRPCSAYLAGQKPYAFKRFTLVLQGYLEGVDQYWDLEGAEPENRATMLRAVRGGLTGKAAEAMDELLARIAEERRT